jgi:trehalose/maltose transport system substrate-binding protein
MLEQGTVDGKILAIPWYADAPALFYRTDLLEKYKMKVPQTWADLYTCASKIQNGEKSNGTGNKFVGYVWEGSANEGLTCCALEFIYSYGGGTIVSAEKFVTLNNLAADEAIEMAQRLVNTVSNGVTSMDYKEVRKQFINGNAAFMRNWQYSYYLCNQKHSKVKGKFKVSPLPAGPGSSGKSANTAGVEMIGVNINTKHPKIAAEFALFLCSSFSQKFRAIQYGSFPTIISLYSDSDIKKSEYFDLPVYYDIFENHSVERPAKQTAPNYSLVSGIFCDAVHSALVDEEVNVDAALQKAAASISNITGFPLGQPSCSQQFENCGSL